MGTSVFCLFLAHQCSHFVVSYRPSRRFEVLFSKRTAAATLEWRHFPPTVSVVVLSCLCYGRSCCIWQEKRFWRDLGFKRRCSPDDGRPLHVWPSAVTVLPREAGACDRRPLALAVGADVCVSRCATTWGDVAAAVGVHPG